MLEIICTGSVVFICQKSENEAASNLGNFLQQRISNTVRVRNPYQMKGGGLRGVVKFI